MDSDDDCGNEGSGGLRVGHTGRACRTTDIENAARLQCRKPFSNEALHMSGLAVGAARSLQRHVRLTIECACSAR